MTHPVTYEVFEGTEGLARLRSAWESLEVTGVDHVFQTYAHADLWQRTVGDPTGAKPILVSLREGERVVGIFPACRVRQDGVPLLVWLGAPRVLDYGDVVFDERAAETPIDAFVTESLRLLSRSARGSLLCLTNVRGDARAFEALRSRLRVLSETTAPFVPVEGTWEDYRASLSRHVRRNLDRQKRRLSREGELGFEVFESDDPAVGPVMCRLVDFQRARFAGAIGRTHLFDEHYVRFRTEQAATPGSRVAAMSLDGTCIAASLDVAFRGRFYSLIAGFDAAHAPRSPSHLLREFSIHSCFDSGGSAYDLCWGDEQYKYDWTASATRLTTFVSDDVRGAALSAAVRWRRMAAEALAEFRRKRHTLRSDD